MSSRQIVLVTQAKYVNPLKVDWYIGQILDEDRYVAEALERLGYEVKRVSWDDSSFDWSSAEAIIFRAIWDYFERFDEFSNWLRKVQSQTKVLNDPSLVWWNIDKSYLGDLEKDGINIPPTVFLKKGQVVNLEQLMHEQHWQEIVMKPNIAGAARETYRINSISAAELNPKLNELLQGEDMMIQEFQHTILSKGEISLMVFGGKFTHAILKRASGDDFRVQDDFGGTVEKYTASQEQISFAESVMKSIKPLPIYGRVDLMWDNDGELSVSEVEIIEPELWFRTFPEAAEAFAESVTNYLNAEK